MTKPRRSRPEKTPKALNARQILFSEMVASGKSNAEAFRRAYRPGKKISADAASDGAKRTLKSPLVVAHIANLRRKSEAKTILSLNDRLAILAKDAQVKGTTPAHINARARVIEVYNKTAGDNAPERHDDTLTVKGDPNAPLQVVTRHATKAEKVAALIAARNARLAAAATPVSP